MGMQLFFRLIRIIQARFHRDQDGDPLNSHGHWGEREDVAGNGTDSDSQAEATIKNFDTVLAG